MSAFFKSNYKITENKTHVIELYCYSDEYTDEVQHEITSGGEIGTDLVEIFKQNVRFIYAPDNEADYGYYTTGQYARSISNHSPYGSPYGFHNGGICIYKNAHAQYPVATHASRV